MINTFDKINQSQISDYFLYENKFSGQYYAKLFPK